MLQRLIMQQNGGENMPKYHDCEQYNDVYDRLRLGIPTSSKFDSIITPEGKPSKSWQKYAYHLIAERLLQRQVNTYTSPHMENGLAMEPEAVAWYEFDTGRKAEKIGFVTNDAGTIGCSPDRLVGKDGLLEVKCPAPNTQVEYLFTGKIDRKYFPQLQGQLYVTGRNWVDIVSWNPELPRITIRVERDIEYIACLEAQLEEFNEYLEMAMAKIAEVTDTVLPDKARYLTG